MKKPMVCGIALGSNLGDRLANLRRAVESLATLPEVVEGSLRKAPVFETAPVDCPAGSAPFLNSALCLDYGGEAHELLSACLLIEKQLGRVRGAVRNAPRPVDIDLIFVGEQRIDEDTLQLPHPRFHERRFVLEPLAALEPDRVLPRFSQSFRALLAALPEANPEDFRRIASTF